MLLAERAFANIDTRIESEKFHHSTYFWRDDEFEVNYCTNEALRLLNEVEKKLMLSNNLRTTFNRIKLVQPIRQWLEASDTLKIVDGRPLVDFPDSYHDTVTGRKLWRKSLAR